MRRMILVLALVSAVGLLAPNRLEAQSLTKGAIIGTVTDSTGAVVVGAKVSAKNTATNLVQAVVTGGTGTYTVPALIPGQYEVTVNQTGFREAKIGPVTVVVGQPTNVDVTLKVGGAVETIEVTAGAPLISTNTESGVNTSFSTNEVQALPNPGMDLTNIALTTPGTVMNSGGGYGNFTTYGLPATSNLFTINGENDMDPYFNINNSGASNLNLGSNEIQEVTITSNSYAGEFGQLSGAQVTMITRSGTNAFHGDARYFWNGRAMNANDWMNNDNGTPLSFSNANQWAASVGGPIKKDSTFFFVDQEGMRFLLPNNFLNKIPTPGFASAVLANVQNLQPNEASTYDTLFKLYAASPGASHATPLPPNTACKNLVLPGFNAGTDSCSMQASGTGTLLGKEWILAARVDQKIRDNDQLYFRWKIDHGLQPTYLDPINTNFNALSNQPMWDTQLSETHIFGPSMTNNFMATLSHYVAMFAQDEAKALGTFPYDTAYGSSVGFTGFGVMRSFPQGRNITQYQFIDDLSWMRGPHNLKFGVNFRRYDVSDHNFFYQNPLVYINSLSQFVNGKQTYYRKALNLSTDVPIALWGAGFYAQDQWNVSKSLKLTLGLRAEHNSNPVCQQNCFANFVAPLSSLPSFTSADPGSVPYNKDIATGLHQAYDGVDSILWAPRIGFSWSPGGRNSWVVSGGYGLFYDNAPAGMVDQLLRNPPIATRITVQPSGGGLGYDTTSAGMAYAWTQSADAFASGFGSGQTFTQIHSALLPFGVNFTPPGFTTIVGTIHSPRWQEWNFQIQKAFGNATALVVNYVGNHGDRILYSNPWANTYDPYGVYVAGVLPTSAPVPNYAAVTQYQNGAISNYNGLTVTLRERLKHGVTAHFNYTWSHNLDEASNGGLFTYSDSILTQLNPNNLRAGNYGNSDYDIRHLFSADFVVSPEFHLSNRAAKLAANGWQLSGKMWWRSGLPMSVIDGNWSGAFPNGAETIMAQPIGGIAGQTQCGRQNATGTGNPDVPPCLNAAAFIDSGSATFAGYTAFSNQTRNLYRGPKYFDTDMALFKTFPIGERVKFGIGAQAYNVFNHPNFYLPNYYLASGDTSFGQISTMTPTPTSPYGAFFGFDSSPRVVQLAGKIEF